MPNSTTELIQPALQAGMNQHPGTSPITTPRPWLAVGSIAVGTFMVVTSEILPVGLLTDIAAYFQVSDGTVGWMITAPGMAATVAALGLGLMVGRTDRRTIFWLLTAIMLLANLAIALAPSFALVLLARVFSGICVGGFWTFSFAAARRLVPHASGDRATALVLAGVSAGTVLGVPAGAMLGAAVGWQWAFGALALLAAVALLIQWLYLPRLPAQDSFKPAHLRAVLGVPQACIVLLFIAVAITGQFGAYTYLKPLLEQVAGMAAQPISLLLLAYGVAGFVGTFVAERAVARHLRVALTCASVLISLVVALSTVAGGSSLFMAILVTLWGFAFGVVPVCIQVWMYRSAPAWVESSSALIVVMFQVAISLGALLGSMLVDGQGVTSAMVLGALLCGLAAVIAGVGVRLKA